MTAKHDLVKELVTDGTGYTPVPKQKPSSWEGRGLKVGHPRAAKMHWSQRDHRSGRRSTAAPPKVGLRCAQPAFRSQRHRCHLTHHAAAATGNVTSATGLGALRPVALLALTRTRTVAPGVSTRSATVSCTVVKCRNGWPSPYDT